MNAKDIIELIDETSAAGLVKMYKKHGKAAVVKFQKVKARIAGKKNKMVKFVGGKPVIVAKTAKQKLAGKKAGRRLAKPKVKKKMKRAGNIRKAKRANKIVNRLGLK